MCAVQALPAGPRELREHDASRDYACMVLHTIAAGDAEGRAKWAQRKAQQKAGLRASLADEEEARTWVQQYLARLAEGRQQVRGAGMALHAARCTVCSERPLLGAAGVHPSAADAAGVPQPCVCMIAAITCQAS